MSQVISFKCPSCGGYLVFDPVKQRFQCPYCGGSFAENELKEQSEQRQHALHPLAAPRREQPIRKAGGKSGPCLKKGNGPYLLFR